MRRWAIVVCCRFCLLRAPRSAVKPRMERTIVALRRPSIASKRKASPREADIRAVLDSAGRELWRFFPNDRIEPIVVTHGRGGPITLFQRNGRGEIVIRLDTEKTYWCQYAYQLHSTSPCPRFQGRLPGQ